MRELWCWRCKAYVPVLDEDEFASAWELYLEAFKATKEFRRRWDIPTAQASIADRFKPVRLRYEQLTGMNLDPAVTLMRWLKTPSWTRVLSHLGNHRKGEPENHENAGPSTRFARSG